MPGPGSSGSGLSSPGSLGLEFVGRGLVAVGVFCSGWVLEALTVGMIWVALAVGWPGLAVALAVATDVGICVAPTICVVVGEGLAPGGNSDRGVGVSLTGVLMSSAIRRSVAVGTGVSSMAWRWDVLGRTESSPGLKSARISSMIDRRRDWYRL